MHIGEEVHLLLHDGAKAVLHLLGGERVVPLLLGGIDGKEAGVSLGLL